MSAKILIIEDDPEIAELITTILEPKGFSVSHRLDGEMGLEAAESETPDVILLDWMLPGISGLEVCRRLRRMNETRLTSIIMLTSRGDEEDKVRGLDMGADDYIPKPFSHAELVARINALLRRISPSLIGDAIEFNDIRLDPKTHRVTRNEELVHLGPTEFKLLRHLMSHPRQVFSRDQLLDAVWGNEVYVEIRTVDVHIRRLRKALNQSGGKDVIRTVRSAGYAIDDME